MVKFVLLFFVFFYLLNNCGGAGLTIPPVPIGARLCVCVCVCVCEKESYCSSWESEGRYFFMSQYILILLGGYQ